jgi:protein-S-isoprenylcysteine O-methyltransferase Ste14
LSETGEKLLNTTQSTEPERPDRAGVAFQPGWLLALVIIVGFLARWIAPLEFLPKTVSTFIGPIVTAASFGLLFWAIYTMYRGDASIPTNEPTTAIVFRGPFRFSRNPIYLSMLLLQLGVGIWANSLWFVGLTALSVMPLLWWIILPEERYLERKFGAEYLSYKARVRRWL